MSVEIIKNGKTVARSKNLRGVITYAGKHLIENVSIHQKTNGGGQYHITFSNGAAVEGNFADYSVLLDWISSRAKRWDIKKTEYSNDHARWVAIERNVTPLKRNPRSIESHELTLFAVNDGNLYRQRIEPILKNLKRKIKSGKYDPALALKLWKYAADDAAQRYAKEFGGVWHSMFSVAARKETAKELAEYYTEQLRENPRRRVTRVRRNPLVSKEPKYVIEAMTERNVPIYYQLGSKGISKPLQGLFTTQKSRASKLQNYNAREVARKILPYLDRRLKWIKVIPEG